ncbi:transporter substrate-binding domain-containing protein [Alteromonas flava]|uniref:transporter substrate-binding domain-containing protein n=1 Tax=Alteromonas flava TaxID=2048003 RepID=UPI000C286E91|nr:transporter substrate-binding domain-containing protein [Alteromonas flava]
MLFTEYLRILLIGMWLILAYGVGSAHVYALSATDQAVSHYNLVMPHSPNRNSRNRYVEELVEQALKTQGQTVSFEYYPFPTNVKRTMLLMGENAQIDLTWMPATHEYVNSFSYITLPLYQGLHGIRLLLIHNDNQQRFAAVNSLDDLAQLMGLQHESWSDTAVLLSNGLSVNRELDYDNMIRAIGLKVADYFPRSAMTIQYEQQKVKEQGIIIEPYLALVYPSYYLLFVSEKSPELKASLQRGVDHLIQEQKFMLIFERYFKDRYQGLDLSQRKKLILKNNDIPPELITTLNSRLMFGVDN